LFEYLKAVYLIAVTNPVPNDQISISEPPIPLQPQEHIKNFCYFHFFYQGRKVNICSEGKCFAKYLGESINDSDDVAHYYDKCNNVFGDEKIKMERRRGKINLKAVKQLMASHHPIHIYEC